MAELEWVTRLQNCLEQEDGAAAQGRREAAVLLALTEEEQPQLLLIRRSLQLALHPGEIAFPGGKREPEDVDLRAAALREAWEEVALPAAAFRYCGSLARRVSMSGLSVAAFVGTIPPTLPLVPDRHEVETLIRVPLLHFAEPARLRVDQVWRDGTQRLAARFQYLDHTVWGMTAGFIVELVNRFYAAGLDVRRHAQSTRGGEI